MENKMRELIEAEKAEILKEEALPQIDFSKATKTEVADTSKNGENSGARELIDESLKQAVKAKVLNDENVQGRILNTAEKVIDNAMSVAENKAEQEDKEAYFNNKKGACECWGYDEATTDKTFVKIMAFIHKIFTAIWIAIGAVTFAPIIFVAKKLTVIVKKTWIAVLVALFIYLLIILIPTLIALLPY